MNAIRVLGTSAYCGSGQDTLADRIALNFGIQKYSSGDVFRAYAKENSLPLTREVLQSIRIEWDQKYGRLYVPTTIVTKIQSDNRNAIITGIRTIEEVKCYKKYFEYLHLFVKARKDIRFNRIIARNDKRDPKNVSEFETQSARELELFDLEQIESISDIVYDFNMSMEEFGQPTVFDSIISQLGLRDFLLGVK